MVSDKSAGTPDLQSQELTNIHGLHNGIVLTIHCKEKALLNGFEERFVQDCLPGRNLSEQKPEDWLQNSEAVRTSTCWLRSGTQ